MKLCSVCCALTLVAAVEGRLFHVPLTTQSDHRRSLAKANPADVDLDLLYQARGIQYAMLKVGCPPQLQSGIISTASHAIGFPCSGCSDNCGELSHLNDFFQEQESTCFKEIKCGDCKLAPNSCPQGQQCTVSISYVEGSSWSGREVEDEISVGGEDSGEEAFLLRFGCQTDVDGLFERQIPDGIFGMNKQEGSAIKQWTEKGYLDASAFSLCYNIREDVEKKSGVMVLGGANSLLHESPMEFAKDVGGGNGNYEVRLKQIRLQGGSSSSGTGASTKSLGLQGKETAVLDSGTTCTYLSSEWYEPFKQAWEQLTDHKYPFFYHLDITKNELDQLPVILFDLEGTKDSETVTVSYPPLRYLEKSPNGGYDFCLYTDDSFGVVILGNTFMSGHDVLHDLDNKQIGFAKSSCNITKIGTSVETDGDKTTTVALQSEPRHKRDPTSPGFQFLYVLIAFSVVGVVGAAFYRRHKRRVLSSNSTTLDGEGDFQTSPNVEMT